MDFDDQKYKVIENENPTHSFTETNLALKLI